MFFELNSLYLKYLLLIAVIQATRKDTCSSIGWRILFTAFKVVSVERESSLPIKYSTPFKEGVADMWKEYLTG